MDISQLQIVSIEDIRGVVASVKIEVGSKQTTTAHDLAARAEKHGERGRRKTRLTIRRTRLRDRQVERPQSLGPICKFTIDPPLDLFHETTKWLAKPREDADFRIEAERKPVRRGTLYICLLQ
jgi:hypothetical protein